MVYYAKDDPLKPKSYDSGIDVRVGVPGSGDLMLIQGPLVVDLKHWKSFILLGIENSSIEFYNSLSMSRVDLWVKANIHVRGNPNWRFIKLHTHGAYIANTKIFLGDGIKKIYSYLGREYNDGANYCLHYVTAREAYNIIKAAEAGLSGDPNQYRDYLIKPYKNTKQMS